MGCLIFTAGCKEECRDEDRAKKGVGHVGIVTDIGSVIHASYSHKKVVEEDRKSFLGGINNYRGCYRVH